MTTYSTPGVYRQEAFPAPVAELRTGVPAFLGYASAPASVNQPIALNLATDFAQNFGAPLPNSYLSYAVQAFFANGGTSCYIVRLDDTLPATIALQNGLDSLTALDSLDLVAAPDIMRLQQPGNLPPNPAQVQVMQNVVVDHCSMMGDRFAILDSIPGGDVVAQRGTLLSSNAALYTPWLLIPGGPDWTGGLVPPCGHVAGVYARTDTATGVHKAPANEVLQGVLDVETDITSAAQAILNPIGINCIRAFPGRGVLVWGARTLSYDTEWTYVSTRRIFLTAGRWIALNLADAIYEPHNARLWTRVTREINAYFNDLFRAGALGGATPADSFYVKCDATTNPVAVRDQGMLVTEIGLRPGVPSEFIVVRIVQSASGVSIAV